MVSLMSLRAAEAATSSYAGLSWLPPDAQGINPTHDIPPIKTLFIASPTTCIDKELGLNFISYLTSCIAIICFDAPAPSSSADALDSFSSPATLSSTPEPPRQLSFLCLKCLLLVLFTASRLRWRAIQSLNSHATRRRVRCVSYFMIKILIAIMPDHASQAVFLLF